MHRKLCPECKGNTFHHDDIHAETVCRRCGLVLTAPNTYGLVFPGYVYFNPHMKKILRVRILNSLSIFHVEMNFRK